MCHTISVLNDSRKWFICETKLFFLKYNLDQPVIEIINEIFRMLLDLIDNKACSGVGRDCCLDLIVKFVDRANGCNWTSKFIISGIANYATFLSYSDFVLCRFTESITSCSDCT